MSDGETEGVAGHGVHDQRTDADLAADERLGPDGGLSGGEAAARLERYGANALAEQRHSVVLEFLSHFWARIPWMIEAAVVLTAVTARWADFGIILALLLLTGSLASGKSTRPRTRSRRSRSASRSRRGLTATANG
jgi:H+-transporting ATPase